METSGSPFNMINSIILVLTLTTVNIKSIQIPADLQGNVPIEFLKERGLHNQSVSNQSRDLQEEQENKLEITTKINKLTSVHDYLQEEQENKLEITTKMNKLTSVHNFKNKPMHNNTNKNEEEDNVQFYKYNINKDKSSDNRLLMGIIPDQSPKSNVSLLNSNSVNNSVNNDSSTCYGSPCTYVLLISSSLYFYKTVSLL